MNSKIYVSEYVIFRGIQLTISSYQRTMILEKKSSMWFFLRVHVKKKNRFEVCINHFVLLVFPRVFSMTHFESLQDTC
jgi:hypothetical protein